MAATPQPYYTVQLNMAGCGYDVRVNDGPLYANVRGYPVVVEMPANRWIRNGGNEVSFHLRPQAGKAALDEGAKASAVVYVREKEADRGIRREVARLEYPGSAAVERRGDETVVAATFSAGVPFGLFRWFTSPMIAEGERTLDELLGELEKFHRLLGAKNMDAILAAVRERDREDAPALYRTIEEQTASSRREYQQFFDETEYALRPLHTKDVRLRIFGSGRLARVDMKNGQSPLYYLTAVRQTAGYLTLVFCRDVTGRWVMIR
jgi:hypothetical protein